MRTRLKLATWFGGSMVAIAWLTAWTSDLHLRHELKVEKWERENDSWTLHGSYSDEEIDDIAGEHTRFWIMVALPFLGLSLGIGYLLARKASGPVRDLNRQIESIHLDTIDRRIQSKGGDPEHEAIAAHINGLLARLEDSFRIYREHSTRVAHELRTPLHALRLQVEQASGHLPPELAESLSDELARLGHLVESILTATRAEQGQLAPNVVNLDWRPFVSDFLESYSRLALEEGRELVVEAVSGEIAVRVDKAQIRQVLHNLLDNAMRHGAGNILWRESIVKGNLEVQIANTPAQTTKNPGLGIGLRLATALACIQPGGDLRVEAAEDRFGICLVLLLGDGPCSHKGVGASARGRTPLGSCQERASSFNS